MTLLYHKITNLSTVFLWFWARKVSLFTISSYFDRGAGAKVPNKRIGHFADVRHHHVQVDISTFYPMELNVKKDTRRTYRLSCILCAFGSGERLNPSFWAGRDGPRVDHMAYGRGFGHPAFGFGRRGNGHGRGRRNGRRIGHVPVQSRGRSPARASGRRSPWRSFPFRPAPRQA